MKQPSVDIVIATIGRHSLGQAIVAAASQSYPNSRVVVIGDGPCPDAKSIFGFMKHGYDVDMIYRETPKRLGGYGDPVKRWWIDNEEAGEYIRFLDDDDWIPPNAIADMMRLWTPDTKVILCSMVLVLPAAQHAQTGQGYWRIQKPALKHRCAASGMAILNTEAARNTDFPAKKTADSALALDCAKQGDAKITDTPLYWYTAHQGGKVQSVDAVQGKPYPKPWKFKPPRSFRMSLFNRVPTCNYMTDAGKPWLVYDQALFRAMATLARKTSWIREKSYYYDIPHPTVKTVPLTDIKRDAALILKRGYISEGEKPEPVAARPGPLVTFIMPAYKCVETIGRAIESIQKQQGDWECIISVDGNDKETAEVALDAVEEDPRFTVVLRSKRYYALGNILHTMPMVTENKVVCFVDADDYLIVDDLVPKLEGMYADPDVEIVSGSNAAVRIVGKIPTWLDGHNTKLKQLAYRFRYAKDQGKRQRIATSAGRVVDAVIEAIETRINHKPPVGNVDKLNRFVHKFVELRNRLLDDRKRIPQLKVLAAIVKTIALIEVKPK